MIMSANTIFKSMLLALIPNRLAKVINPRARSTQNDQLSHMILMNTPQVCYGKNKENIKEVL